MAGPRRRSREIALQILHQMDAGARSGCDGRRAALLRAPVATRVARPSTKRRADRGRRGWTALTGENRIDRPLVEELVRGVSSRRAEMDEMLTNLSRNWRLERMAVVERNIIRIALYELQYSPAVPINVVLNEAVELAKRYGTRKGPPSSTACSTAPPPSSAPVPIARVWVARAPWQRSCCHRPPVPRQASQGSHYENLRSLPLGPSMSGWGSPSMLPSSSSSTI